MKKTLKIIGIVLLAILLLFGIYKLVTYKEPPFDKKIEFDGRYTVINHTKEPYLDTIVQAGLTSMNADSVNVTILPIKLMKNIKIEGIDLKAFITGTGNVYVLYIEESGRSRDIEILSHELIHLKQYQDGRLILSDNYKTAIWLGDTCNIKDYNLRPWEIEAFRDQINREKKIRELLYK